MNIKVAAFTVSEKSINTIPVFSSMQITHALGIFGQEINVTIGVTFHVVHVLGRLIQSLSRLKDTFIRSASSSRFWAFVAYTGITSFRQLKPIWLWG